MHIRRTPKVSYRHTLYSHPLPATQFPSQHVHSRFSSDSRFHFTTRNAIHQDDIEYQRHSIHFSICSKGACFFLSSSRDRAASAHRLLTAVRRLTTSRSQPAPSLQASTRRLRLAKDPGCAVFIVTMEFVRPVAAEPGVREHDGIVGSSCDRVKAAHRKIDIVLKAWAGGILRPSIFKQRAVVFHS